jgi:hypothetical protein
MLTHVAGLSEALSINMCEHLGKIYALLSTGAGKISLLPPSQITLSVLTEAEDVQPLKHLARCLHLDSTLPGSL